MANNLSGKIWSIDTTTAISSAGIITTNPVCIHSIRVRFTTAGVGSCVITDCKPNDYINNMTVLDLKTTAATSVYTLDAQYSFGDQTFMGLRKTVMVNVETVYIVTGNPK